MRERSAEQKEKYKRVRSEFEDLEIEDKALFLLEATVGTVARGVEQFGKGFAEEIDKAFRQAKRESEERAESESSAGESSPGTAGTTGSTAGTTGSTAGASETSAGTAGSTSDFSKEKKSTKPPTAADDGDEPII